MKIIKKAAIFQIAFGMLILLSSCGRVLDGSWEPSSVKPEGYDQIEDQLPTGQLSMENLKEVFIDGYYVEGIFRDKAILSSIEIYPVKTQTGYIDGQKITGLKLYDMDSGTFNEIKGLEGFFAKETPIRITTGEWRAQREDGATNHMAVMKDRYYYQWFYEAFDKAGGGGFNSKNPQYYIERQAYLIQIDLQERQAKIVDQIAYYPFRINASLTLHKLSEECLLGFQGLEYVLSDVGIGGNSQYILKEYSPVTGQSQVIKDYSLGAGDENYIQWVQTSNGGLYALGYQKKTAPAERDYFLYTLDYRTGEIVSKSLFNCIGGEESDKKDFALLGNLIIGWRGKTYASSEEGIQPLQSEEERDFISDSLNSEHGIKAVNFYDYSAGAIGYSSLKMPYFYMTKTYIEGDYVPLLLNNPYKRMPAIYAWNVETLEQRKVLLPKELQECLYFKIQVDEVGNMLLSVYYPTQEQGEFSRSYKNIENKRETYYIPKETLETLAAGAQPQEGTNSSAA